MSDQDDKDRSRDSGRERDRDRSRRNDRSSRYSEGGGGGNTRDRSTDRGGDRSGGSSNRRSSSRVYVSNISYEYRWQDLKDLFREHVGEVTYVELFVDDRDKPRGCGIVEFSDASSVKKCMEVMHRFDVKGRKLVIKEDYGNERDKYGNIVTGRRNQDRDRDRDRRSVKDDWDDRDNRRSNWEHNPPSLLSNMIGRHGSISDAVEFKWGNTYGLSPQFLESLNIHKPLVSRVFVANLDYKVDDKKLREVFKLCGKVIDVEIYRDKDGNSRGFAVVEYDHPVESVQAISMLHNQTLYDRTMTVRMDRLETDVPLKLPDGLKGVGVGLGVNGEPLRDVNRNLPSSTTSASIVAGSSNTTTAGGGGGSGSNIVANETATAASILGAVSNQASLQNLGQTAASLSSVANTAALANFNSLQASLAGVQSPFLNTANLSRNLGGGDLGGLAALNSSLGNLTPSQLVALSASTAGNNAANNLGASGSGGGVLSGSNTGNSSTNNLIGNRFGTISYPQVTSRDYGHGRSENNSFSNEFFSNVSANQSAGNTSSSSGNLLTREYTSSSSGRDYDQGTTLRTFDIIKDQDNFLQNNALYSTVNNGSQNNNRSLNVSSSSKGNGFSDTVIVSNLPITATWKVLKEKFSNAGDVLFVEMRSKDTAVIKFASDWQAERAIKLMDRIRIDGRTLDVRFFY